MSFHILAINYQPLLLGWRWRVQSCQVAGHFISVRSTATDLWDVSGWLYVEMRVGMMKHWFMLIGCVTPSMLTA